MPSRNRSLPSRRAARGATLGMLLLVWAAPAAAQDSHYWSNAFGSRSALLGGAVVGGVRDASAAYYNPGALGFVGNANLTVGANAFRFSDLHVTDGVGGASELDSEELEAIPLLVSGTFRPFGLSSRHLFAYSLLARNSHSLKLSTQTESRGEVLTSPNAAGPERFVGEFSREDQLLEVWGGLSYAARPQPAVSLGVTMFAALRNQDFKQTVSARALNEQTHAVATRDDHFEVDYWNLRLLWKAGAAAEYGPWRLGLALTTPSVNVGGSGSLSDSLTLIHLDVDRDGTLDHFFATTKRDGLDSEFRSPFSVAGGVDVAVTSSTRLCASAEWFARQSGYSVLSAEDAEFSAAVATVVGMEDRAALRVTHQGRPVFDVGLGLEQQLFSQVSAYLGFRTDRTYLSDGEDDGVRLGYTAWDLYHGTVGVRLQRENSDFGLGFGYTYGRRRDFPQAVSFSEPTQEGLLAGERGKAGAQYQAFVVLLGATYYVR